MCLSGRTSLPVDCTCCFYELPVLLLKNPTKRVGQVQSRSSSHRNIICSRRDKDENLLTWCLTPLTLTLFHSKKSINLKLLLK